MPPEPTPQFDEPSTLGPTGTPPMVSGSKWIRGTLDGLTVVNARDFMFVWEVSYWPWWFFSRDDIAAEIVLAVPGEDGVALADGQRPTFYDLVIGDHVLECAARGYPDSTNDALRDLVAIDFGALDHWFEEDIEVYVHPRSPFTRVDALASSRHVVVSLDGVVLADSRKPTILYETGAPGRHYLPALDVELGLLSRNSNQASCPYKGDAHFYSAMINGTLVDDIAWQYTLPRAEVLPVAGMICFYDERVDVDVDGVRQARPVSHFA